MAPRGPAVRGQFRCGACGVQHEQPAGMAVACPACGAWEAQTWLDFERVVAARWPEGTETEERCET